MRALLIVNPAAGQQGPVRIADAAREKLRGDGWEVESLPTSAGGHAAELARAHGARCDRVVVVGGDGTLRETLLGLGLAGDGIERPPIAMVPIGKANVVARELGIPLVPSAAIAALSSETVREIDVGTVAGTLFLAMVGVGYDAVVTEGVRWIRETRGGRVVYTRGGSSLVYAAAGVPALLRVAPPRLTVIRDGQELPGDWVHAVIANTETYATGWSMTPGAVIDDGLLDHHLNRRSAPWFLLWTLGASAMRARLPALVAEYGRGAAYEIRGAAPFAWQIDGDSMPRTDRLEIGIHRRAARLVVPAG